MFEHFFSYAIFASLKKNMKNIVTKSLRYLFPSLLLEANEGKASLTSPYNNSSRRQREITMTIDIQKLRKLIKMTS